METNQFKLEQRSTTEIVSEIISEKFKVIYSYNHEVDTKPKAVSFNIIDIENENARLLSGSYLAEINQFEIRTIQDIEGLGDLTELILTSCKELVKQKSN